MAPLRQQMLQHDVLRAEQYATRVGQQFGRQSAEYYQALRRLMRLWYVLRLTRRNEEFFAEVAQSS